MQFKSLFLAATAFSLACAQPAFTNTAFAPVAGQPIELTWSGASGSVTIKLKNGPAGNLQDVATIASGIVAASYVWTPSSSLPNDQYALEINDASNVPNYSPQFQVAGASGAASSAAASSGVASGAPISTVIASLSSASASTASATSSSPSGSANTTTESSAAASSTPVESSSLGSSNSTATPSSSKPSSTASTSASKTSPSHTGTSSGTATPTSSAGGLSSPIVFVFLAFAAIFMLN